MNTYTVCYERQIYPYQDRFETIHANDTQEATKQAWLNHQAGELPHTLVETVIHNGRQETIKHVLSL